MPASDPSSKLLGKAGTALGAKAKAIPEFARKETAGLAEKAWGSFDMPPRSGSRLTPWRHGGDNFPLPPFLRR